MKWELLDLLACPDCGGELIVVGVFPSEGLGDGSLECCGCRRTFHVRRGIPRLLPAALDAGSTEAASSAHFANEFAMFADDASDLVDERTDELQFFSRIGIDPEAYEHVPEDPYAVSPPASGWRPDHRELRGKVVLDAGCGPGRFTRVAAGQARHVVGLDLGDHVERAAAFCADLSNVDIVQGSVLRPPFRRAVFDVAFSVGVLHHTPDPAGGVRALADVVHDEGALAVWVYPPEYWNGRVRGPVARSIHRVMRMVGSRRALWLCRHLLFPLGRLQQRLAKRRWTKLLAAPLFVVSVPRHQEPAVMLTTIVDYYGAPIISTHRATEVVGWFRDSGFEDVRALPVPTSVIGRARRR